MAEVETHTQPDGLAYRPDVDGLRGVAVLLVVLWHAGLSHVRGGFVGVDAFFVISGYVITGTLQRDATGGGISFLRFYERRLRRIAPAFLVMLTVVLAAGFVIQFPLELRRTAGAAVAALAVSANLALWRQGGYWGQGAETEPLRHVWSLSVEEQFYLVYPLLLAWLLTRGRRVAVGALVALAVASLALFQWVSSSAPAAAFELAPMRLWELLLGCLIALEGRRWRPPRPFCEALALAGVVLLAIAVLGPLRRHSDAILLAAPGAALLIFAGQRPTAAAWLLARPPVVFVGLISYSLYLWHWPLLALAKSLQPAGLGASATAALLAATAVLGLLSWRFVEQPLRRPWKTARERWRFLAACGALAAISLAMATVALAGGGWPGRFSAPAAALADYERYRDTAAWSAQFRVPCYPRREDGRDYNAGACFTAAPDRKNVLLWGDSHAGALAESFAELTARLGAHPMQAALSGCPPMQKQTFKDCEAFDAMVRTRLRAVRPDVVVLSFSDDPVREPDLPELLDWLRASGATVIVIGPTPDFKSPPSLVLARAWPNTPGAGPLLEPGLFERDARLAALARAHGAQFVDAANVLCPARRCRLAMADGAPIVWDRDHLSRAAAREVVSVALAPVLAQALKERPPPAAIPARRS